MSMFRCLPDKRRVAALLWLLASGVVLLFLGLHLFRAGRNWPLGDWLINYEGGFVRRGLLGEVLLLIGRATGADPIALALGICLLCYTALFVALWWLIRNQTMEWWSLFALLSPATLTFPLLSTRAGFHKEVLLYAALAAMLWICRETQRMPSTTRLSISLSAVCVLLLLSHEPLIFYLPYLFVVPALATQSVRTTLRICALPACCSLVCFVLVLRHIGTPETVRAVCQSVQHGQDPCADPIGFLTMTRSGQLSMVRENIAQFHYDRIYPVLLLLSVLPFIVGVRALWQRSHARPLLLQAILACVIASIGSIALFRFGPDWGRWVAMHAICLLLLLLWIAQKSVVDEHYPRPSYEFRHLSLANLAWTAGLVLYATCWSMPGFGDSPLHGMLGLLLHRP